MLDQLREASTSSSPWRPSVPAARPTILAVTALAGAILGVMISVEFYWVEHPGSDLVALIDGALATSKPVFRSDPGAVRPGVRGLRAAAASAGTPSR